MGFTGKDEERLRIYAGSIVRKIFGLNKTGDVPKIYEL